MAGYKQTKRLKEAKSVQKRGIVRAEKAAYEIDESKKEGMGLKSIFDFGVSLASAATTVAAATTDQTEAWSQFEEGREAVGLDRTDTDLSFWDNIGRKFKGPDVGEGHEVWQDISSGGEGSVAQQAGHQYSTGELQRIGRENISGTSRTTLGEAGATDWSEVLGTTLKDRNKPIPQIKSTANDAPTLDAAVPEAAGSDKGKSKFSENIGSMYESLDEKLYGILPGAKKFNWNFPKKKGKGAEPGEIGSDEDEGYKDYEMIIPEGSNLGNVSSNVDDPTLANMYVSTDITPGMFKLNVSSTDDVNANIVKADAGTGSGKQMVSNLENQPPDKKQELSSGQKLLAQYEGDPMKMYLGENWAFDQQGLNPDKYQIGFSGADKNTGTSSYNLYGTNPEGKFEDYGTMFEYDTASSKIIQGSQNQSLWAAIGSEESSTDPYTSMMMNIESFGQKGLWK